MNMAMFALIHLCVQVNAKDRIVGQYKDHVFTGECENQNSMTYFMVNIKKKMHE